ncbi:MAG TPA: LemA family protein [Vicinamibacteria bacterium]|nr:LemA family protein [Vicinamibacteria bacterium]
MSFLFVGAIAAGVILLVIVWAIAMYNGLIRLRNTCDNAWSDVDVQLKKRHDLIPNLVETVKGYAKHEKDTLERVIQARTRAVGAPSPDAKMEAENLLTSALRQLFALAEAYPDLKANQNFIQLQGDLSRIESDIADARRYFNAVVRDFNTRQQVFPANLIASALGFQVRNFFEAEEEARKAVRVQF